MSNIVKINEQDCTLVQKSYFEYNSILHVLEYMVESNKFPKELINEYVEKAAQKNIELELLKNELINKYLPNTQYSHYSIQFDTNEIIYEV